MDIGDTVRSVVRGMPSLVTGGVPGYRAGEQKLAWNRADLTGADLIALRSPAFEDGGTIPPLYGADGDDISPPLQWSGLPPSAQSLVLVVEDPDAPTPEPFVHWLVYGLSPATTSLPQNIGHEWTVSATDAMQGKNSNLKLGWTGMAPPKGDTPHRYFFQLFALKKFVSLAPGAGRTSLFEAMSGQVIGRGQLTGTFERS